MKKLYILLISAVGVFSSCSDSLLDIDNPNEATPETFWKTAEDAEAGVNACYSALYKEGTWMRWLSFRYDLTSDEGLSTSPWNELADWTRFNYTNYNFYEGNNIHWEHFYMAIFRSNQVLKYVPDIEMDAAQKERVLGQAKFFRALFYFQINILWNKGTLVTEPTGAGYIPEDASEAQIWTLIEQDLKDASTLPESWDAANKGRVTKGAAKALLAKAYMQQGKYDLAKTELQWLIDQEGRLYGLVGDWASNFTHFNENNIESVFEIQFDDTNKGGTGNDASMATGFQRTQFYAPNGIGWADGKARRWLVDEFLKEKKLDGKNDTRLYHSVFYRDFPNDFPEESKKYYRFANVATDWNTGEWGNECFIRKYNTSYYRDFEDYFAPNNYRIIRYADVLLNYAECIIETGGTTTDAAVHVNKVRTRAGLATLSNSIYASSLNSREAFMKRLQMERSLELCFEGWRWADLKRWGLLNTQAGIDELKSRDPDFNNFIIGKHDRLPVPQLEIDNSEGNLTQNPMY